MSRCEVAAREPRRTAHQRGYTRRWDKESKAFRVRYPLCGMRPGGQRPVMSQCNEQGRTTAATQTDHVVPHRGDVGLFWNVLNWQALCAACGLRKTRAGL